MVAPEPGDVSDYVSALRPDPSQPPIPTLTLQGLLGDSDRDGFRRLYFNRQLDYYAEFRSSDVLHIEVIPPEQPPIIGLEASRITLRRDASVEFTQVRTSRPVDEFDLDIRLSNVGRSMVLPTTQVDCPETELGCPPPRPTDLCDTDHCPPPGTGGTGETCGPGDSCDCPTETPRATCVGTCETCNQQTCQTCQTQCGQATCGGTCNQATCNQRTCQGTCDTCAGGATCARTCDCETMNPRHCGGR